MIISRNQLKKENRNLAILKSLDKLDFLTTSQIMQLHDLKSRRNTNRIINSHLLPFLNFFKEAENIYYLNNLGRELVGSTKKVTKTHHTLHTVMRNQLFIHLKEPKEWNPEKKYMWDSQVLIVDAIYKKGSFYVFCEIDHKQTMKENERKLEKYADFKDSGAFQTKYFHFPEMLWLTTSEYRKERLKKLCNNYELNANILCLDDVR